MMKSSDIEKASDLLGGIKSMESLIETIDGYKSKGLRVDICCEHTDLWFDHDISKEVFNTILRELNIRKEKTIKELAELGVEYVE